jgi:hypothetical protein
MRKLYAIENQDDLVGKTIAYTQLAGFNNPALLITTDGGFCMWTIEVRDEEFEETYNQFLNAKLVQHKLFHQNSRLLERLINKGIFTQEEVDGFFANQIAEREEEERQRKIRREQEELKEFERLKAKFEGGGAE